MVSVLERGEITFFYRPTVQPAGAVTFTPGVQSFFLITSPAGRALHRRVRVGRKRMPAPTGERFWAVVERVGSLHDVLGDQLEAARYTTRTRGERYQAGARAIAEGCYAFVRHEEHTHFVYRVDRLEADVPPEVAVPAAASHLVLFERVDQATGVWTTGGLPLRFDTEGEELVLVGVDEDPERELGIDVLPGAQ